MEPQTPNEMTLCRPRMIYMESSFIKFVAAPPPLKFYPPTHYALLDFEKSVYTPWTITFWSVIKFDAGFIIFQTLLNSDTFHDDNIQVQVLYFSIIIIT